jgi:hypothetical protein
MHLGGRDCPEALEDRYHPRDPVRLVVLRDPVGLGHPAHAECSIRAAALWICIRGSPCPQSRLREAVSFISYRHKLESCQVQGR